MQQTLLFAKMSVHVHVKNCIFYRLHVNGNAKKD